MHETRPRQPNPDTQQAREICRDLAVELIRKSGVQSFEDKTQFKQIAQTAIEMTRKITEAFEVK